MLTLLQPLEFTNLSLCLSSQERVERNRVGFLLLPSYTAVPVNGFETVPSL